MHRSLQQIFKFPPPLRDNVFIIHKSRGEGSVSICNSKGSDLFRFPGTWISVIKQPNFIVRCTVTKDANQFSPKFAARIQLRHYVKNNPSFDLFTKNNFEECWNEDTIVYYCILFNFLKNSHFVHNTLFANNRGNFLKKTRKKKCAELLSEIAIENFVFKWDVFRKKESFNNNYYQMWYIYKMIQK